ncbi:MAG: hypothetical protein H6Q70_2006 [Firmicutes bacterium]|nr:hypothetical protein [Bacillota bacterium]
MTNPLFILRINRGFVNLKETFVMKIVPKAENKTRAKSNIMKPWEINKTV